MERLNIYVDPSETVGARLASDEQCRTLKQQVAGQTAKLLQLAHALRLQPLLSVLHQFLMLNVMPASGRRLLTGCAGLVFTDAVLEAALGSSTLSKEAYVSSVIRSHAASHPA
jgi:hypothetical protein